MKKALFLLVALLCLMTSCQRVEQTDEEFHLDSLGDIGEFSGKASEKRFYDEMTYDFIPSEEYGLVIPYVGSYRVYELPEADTLYSYSGGYCSYGFCTPDGKIVMDASFKNTFITYTRTSDGFCFYTVHREQQPKADAPDEFTQAESLIIPFDGTWCLTLGKNSWVSSAGGGYINVCAYAENDGSAENAKIHMYDYDGRLVRTVEGTDSVGKWSHGLMLISSWTNDGFSGKFVDENGNTVLGPYKAATDFNEHGITAVEDAAGAYLVNTRGERLTEYYKSFYREYSSDMKKHLFVGRTKENNKVLDVYSEKGELLGRAEGSSYVSFRFCDNGQVLYYFTKYDTDEKGNSIYNSEKMIWKYLSDGKDFVSQEFGVSPNSYSGADNCFVHIDKEKQRAILFDCDGKTLAVIDGATDIINTTHSGEYVIYIKGTYEYGYDENTGKPYPDTRTTHIYDSEKKQTVFSMQGVGTNAHFSDENRRFVLISVYEYDEEMPFFGTAEASRSLFDTKTGKLVLENCREISLWNIKGKYYISACTKNSSVLYDEQFNVIRKSYFE